MPATQPRSAPVSTVPVGIYTRVSTPNQVGGRFDSCESQAAYCRDFLGKHAVNEGWLEVACFTDAAYSGGSLNRPGIQALMRQIEAGSIKVVLIFKLERVLRSTNEWGPFRAFLRKHGCRLVSATEDLSEETPSGRLKNNIVMSVNEYERENTAEKIHLKLVEQAKRGFWTGGQVPYGYDYDAAVQGLVPNAAEAAILRRIYEQAAQLVSLTDIANTLNAEGVRTRARLFQRRDGTKQNIGEKRFRTDILRRLILRPLYSGRVRMHGTEYPGQHEAIVSQDLWERANAAVRSSLQPARCRLRARDKHFHVLKGIAICGCCGRAMVPNASGKRDASGQVYRYYTCGYSHKEGSDARCPVRHVSANALESAVTAFLGQCSRHPEILRSTAESAQHRTETERAPHRTRLSEIDRTLAELNRQLRNCAQAIAHGGLEALAAEVREEANALQTQKQTLLVEREQVRQDLAACEEKTHDPERIRRSLERFSELLPTLAAEQQRDLMLLFLERVEIRPATKSNASAGTRLLELRFKLRVARLIEGMEEKLVIEARERSATAISPSRRLVLNAEVAMAQTGAVALVAPFACALSVANKTDAAKRSADMPVQHPLHRARAWQRRLGAETELTRVQLAAAEGLTPGSVTHHMKLLQLAPEIQERLLNVTTRSDLRRFSLNRMKALADLPLEEQRRRFAMLLRK